MRKQPTLWFSLCLSSLVATVSLVATTLVKTSATPVQVIAQANRSSNVGGPLAKQLQGKPVVVDIYASWCPACKNIAPTLSQLKQQYGGRVQFVVLDVTDKSKASQAESRKQVWLPSLIRQRVIFWPSIGIMRASLLTHPYSTLRSPNRG